MSKLFWIFISLLAGALLPIQAGLNSKLGKSIASPVYASLTSFLVGAIALVLYVLFTNQSVDFSGAKNAPIYVWVAGALGAFYVTAVIFAFPKIGPALTFGLVVGGQMMMAIVIDHFGIQGVQPHPINFTRVIGVALIVIGVLLIRKF